MKASPIIPELDIACDVLPCFLPRWVNGAVDPLDFQGRVERFRQGIVKSDACPAHGLAYPQPAQDRRELCRGVIAAPIRKIASAGSPVFLAAISIAAVMSGVL